MLLGGAQDREFEDLGPLASCVTSTHPDSISLPVTGILIPALPSLWSTVHCEVPCTWEMLLPHGLLLLLLASNERLPATARVWLPPPSSPPESEMCHKRATSGPGLGCVLWGSCRSFDLSSLMWRLKDQVGSLLSGARMVLHTVVSL